MFNIPQYLFLIRPPGERQDLKKKPRKKKQPQLCPLQKERYRYGPLVKDNHYDKGVYKE